MKFRSLLVASAAAMFALVSTSPVLAQEGSAKVRIAHLSPDAPAVDVYIDGRKMLTNVVYDKHSAYLDVAAKPGTVVEVRQSGSAADTPAAIKVEADLTAGKSYTIAAIGKLAAITGKVYEDDVSEPPAGKVKLRIIHAAPDVKPVDVVVKNGATLAAKLTFPDATPYLTLDPGTYAVEVRESGSTTAIVSNDVVLNRGGVYTVAAIGGADKPPKLKGMIDLAAKAPGATTTVSGGSAATGTTVAGAAATTVAPTTVAPTTVATEVAATTLAEEPAETTVAEATTIAEATEEEPPTETTVEAVEEEVPEEEVPASTVPTPVGGVPSGAGGLAGGGALGLTALFGASAAVLAVVAQRRRSAR